MGSRSKAWTAIVGTTLPAGDTSKSTCTASRICVLPLYKRRRRTLVRRRRRVGGVEGTRPRGEVDDVRPRAVAVVVAFYRRVLLGDVLSRQRKAGQAAVPVDVWTIVLRLLCARPHHAVAGRREPRQARGAGHVPLHAPLLDAHGTHERQLAQHQVRGDLGVVGRASRVKWLGGKERLLQWALQPRPRLWQRRDPVESVPIACDTHHARVGVRRGYERGMAHVGRLGGRREGT
eukprot:scaffold57144_cov66-Phaeocystis_antarctica.AAC.4